MFDRKEECEKLICSCYCNLCKKERLAKSEKCKPKLKVSIEDDSFEVEMEVLDNAKTRSYLTIAVFTIGVLLALIATIHGFMTGDFDGVIAVGIFVEAPMMSVLGYYYGKNHDYKEN